MLKRTSDATWEGDLKSGKGTMRLGSGAYEGTYGFQSRFENGPGTNPEELIAAAHAGCFSMALSHGLAQAGTPPTSVDTTADVTFQAGKGITGIKLTVRGVVPGISPLQFEEAAQDAKANCPVSQALTGTTITLEASLAES